MERLWTPWRLGYVTAASRVTPDCIFCAAVAAGESDPLVVHRAERSFVILNKFPYNNGHLMVVPRRHAARLAELDTDELLELMTLAQAAERALMAIYRPHGFNLGINLGKPAGAGIADHLHLHVVPRWDGDTSFMAVVGETKVLPETIETTYGRLTAALSSLDS